MAQGDGSFADNAISADFSGSGWTSTAYTHHFKDVDGDGLPDLVLMEKSEANAYVFPAQGNGGFASVPVSTDVSGNGWNSNAYQRFFEDVNGDGASDLILVENSEATVYVFLAKGDGLFAHIPVSTDVPGSGWSLSAYERNFVDVNGDGMRDLVLYHIADAAAYTFLAQGDGAFSYSASTDIAGSGWSSGAYAHYFLDIDGNGKVDMILLPHSEAIHNCLFSLL